ncbi:MAG: hypothetical protein GWO04_29925, partial [Actinobacteria bacterium]|nr:hypothetical protein [Actinomycetota bacterium]
MTLFRGLWDFDDPSASEERFEALLASGDLEGDLDAELQLRTQIARAQGLQRRFDEARETLEEVERRLPDSPSPATARWLLET